jgi:hypothetical protein
MMTLSHPPRQPAPAAEHVILFPDGLERRARPQPARPSTRRDTGTIEHWNKPYHPQTSAGFDLVIIAVWKQHVAGAIDWDAAGIIHHVLAELRDQKAVRA